MLLTWGNNISNAQITQILMLKIDVYIIHNKHSAAIVDVTLIQESYEPEDATDPSAGLKRVIVYHWWSTYKDQKPVLAMSDCLSKWVHLCLWHTHCVTMFSATRVKVNLI